MGGILFDPLGGTGVVAAKSLRGITDPAEVELSLEVFDDVRAPVAAGERVGTITIADGTSTVGTVPAITTSAIDEQEEPGWGAAVLETILSGAAAILPGEGS